MTVIGLMENSIRASVPIQTIRFTKENGEMESHLGEV